MHGRRPASRGVDATARGPIRARPRPNLAIELKRRVERPSDDAPRVLPALLEDASDEGERVADDWLEVRVSRRVKR